MILYLILSDIYLILNNLTPNKLPMYFSGFSGVFEFFSPNEPWGISNESKDGSDREKN